MTFSMTFRGRQQGLTLIELMIALIIDLIILAAAFSMFVANSKTRQNVERMGAQVENGRYSLETLSDNLQNAGYLAELNPEMDSSIPTPATVPNPCNTATADLVASMKVYIQGYDDSSGGLGCISDVKSGTDVLVIRRASTCASGSAACVDLAGAPYFQASLCNNNTELLGGVYYKMNTNLSALNLHQRDCTTPASQYRYLTHIYFVANNDVAGDGIPTLKRAELGAGGFTISPLAEGIENLQIEYGLDTSGDGLPDSFKSDPGAGCAAADCVKNWMAVVTARVNLLARATAEDKDYVDVKTYTVGVNASGLEQTFGPYNDKYRRNVFSQLVRINNAADRKGS